MNPEKPKKGETSLQFIDRLVEKVMDGQTIVVKAPTGRVYQIRNYYGSLSVAHKIPSNLYWKQLNAGSNSPPVQEKLRIVLGQIFAGKRESGLALHNLSCSRTITDGHIGVPGHNEPM